MVPPGLAGDGMRVWRQSVSVRSATGALYSIDDVLEATKADADLVQELEEFGVVKGELRGGVRYFDETERDIIAAVPELARYGVGGRNLDPGPRVLQRHRRRSDRCDKWRETGRRPGPFSGRRRAQRGDRRL